MYNRYVPQPDGTFRRTYIESPKESCASTERKECPAPTPHRAATNEFHPKPVPKPCTATSPRSQGYREKPRKKKENPMDFLKNLLPKDFDTSDLFVVVLLLLMAGDNTEDKSTALLTLALYFIM